MRDIIDNVANVNEMYDKILGVIMRDFPATSPNRVRKTANYLRSLFQHYDDRGQKVSSYQLRGICAEIMLEIIMLEHKASNPNVLVMKNLLIPLEDGTTTQLDFIAISPTNITVIEVKSLFGLLDIAGGEVRQEWMLPNGDWKRQVLKPWNQNLLHIIALKRYLGLNGIHLQNLVFLFSIGRIKSYYPYKDYNLLTYENHIETLDKVLSMGDRLIPKDEMKIILSKLKNTIPTQEQEAKHIQELKDKHKRKV